MATLLLTSSGYEWTRAWFEKAALKANRPSKRLTTIETMIAGAIAGSATVLMTNPIWVINTRMTTRKSESDEQVLPGSKPTKAPSTLGTLLALLRDEGPARLFSGVMPALVLVINPILQYTVFEQMKQMLEKKRRVTPKDAFYLGALGKLLATSITYPYITVKSRMHVAGRDGPREDMLTTFRRIIREEGYTGLYGGKLDLRCQRNIQLTILGIGPKVTQSVITAAFLFAFKDALYSYTVAARKKIAAK
jgi:adenine nucleotide transporter 17